MAKQSEQIEKKVFQAFLCAPSFRKEILDLGNPGKYSSKYMFLYEAIFVKLLCLPSNIFAQSQYFFSLTGCAPTKCGRAVLDNVVSAQESDKLLELAKKGFVKGGGSGGASILDLHSGALSKVQ